MNKTYLCGPILNCNDSECIDWREEAKKNLKDTLDPMRRDYRGIQLDHIKEIVEEDKKDIDECDSLLVKFDYPSVGTSMEILYAWERKKFIVTVVENPDIVVSPWLIYHSSAVVKTFKPAYDLLNNTIITDTNGKI